MKKTKAHTRYKNSKGKVVPGVTTIISADLGWNKGALVGWARKMALAGEDPNKVRDNAADIGTLAHYLIERHCKGATPDVSEYSPADLELAQNALSAYIAWEAGIKPDYVAHEIPCVSDKFGFGGTVDMLCRVGGALWLVDFKTCTNIYREHVIQVAAYQQAFVEARGESVQQVHILRVGKDGAFEHHRIPDESLGFGWQVFCHLLAIHKLGKVLKV